MKTMALIKNGIVINRILADDSFDATLYPEFDPILDVTDIHANIGDEYDGTNFATPMECGKVSASVSVNADPITLSGASNSMSVTLVEGIIDIGCINFDALYVKNTLTTLIQESAPYVDDVQASKDGAVYKGFTIAWADCQTLIDYLTAAGV
jgi:hypothetical protein